MHFTREQVKTIIEKMVDEEGGMQVLLQMGLEALMKAERSEYNAQPTKIKAMATDLG